MGLGLGEPGAKCGALQAMPAGGSGNSDGGRLLGKSAERVATTGSREAQRLAGLTPLPGWTAPRGGAGTRRGSVARTQSDPGELPEGPQRPSTAVGGLEVTALTRWSLWVMPRAVARGLRCGCRPLLWGLTLPQEPSRNHSPNPHSRMLRKSSLEKKIGMA